MKYVLIFAFVLLIYKPVIAQQNAVDNSLLLDYYQTQHYADAYNYLKTVYPEPVTNTKALSQLAYTSQMAGKLNDAEGYYTRVYAQDSTNIATLFSLGGINVSRGNNLKALVFYKKILLRDSTNFNVFKQLASLSQNLMDTVNYTKYLLKANVINPEEPDVAYDLSALYISTKKYDKAGLVLDIAIKADTNNLVLLKGKAKVSFLQKKYPETITECIKLIQAGDKQAVIINWLGIAYFNTKQYKLCIATFQTLDLTLQNESTYYYVAMSYKALKDNVNAIDYLSKALVDGISPRVGNYYIEMADSYEQLHKYQSAIAAYQKSTEFKYEPLTFYSLANLYDTELHSNKNALKYYKKYIAAKPEERQKTYIDYAQSRITTLVAH
jgi:tetratricopeptide (TPR) repeat protein